jgi:hypothetical protein
MQRRPRPVRVVLALAAALAVVSGCARSPGPDAGSPSAQRMLAVRPGAPCAAPAPLVVNNQTRSAVDVVMNGGAGQSVVIGTAQPGRTVLPVEVQGAVTYWAKPAGAPVGTGAAMLGRDQIVTLSLTCGRA